ncbi:MAG: hypothetical protein LBI60_03990 [Bacteroidales bacterium]|nr:hypothetical protein [Bacteroidales bacterium]
MWKIDGKSCSRKQGIEEFFQKTRNIEEQLSLLNEEIKQIKRQLGTQQQSLRTYDSPSSVSKQSIVSPSFDQTIESFNAWAKYPGQSLPSQFQYAEGDLTLREKQDIRFSSTNNATWIINKSGPAKYLFPNPNAIDQIGGKIDILYSVTGNRRARGQNKVNIQKACVIMEDGWIEYKGELSLI